MPLRECAGNGLMLTYTDQPWRDTIDGRWGRALKLVSQTLKRQPLGQVRPHVMAGGFLFG